MYSNPELLHNILAKVTEVVKLYMEKQIKSGIDVVQIFDSWAAAIEPSKYNEFSWKYMVEIADYLKSKYPETPIIMFPKGVTSFIEQGLVYGNFDVQTYVRLKNRFREQYGEEVWQYIQDMSKQGRSLPVPRGRTQRHESRKGNAWRHQLSPLRDG